MHPERDAAHERLLIARLGDSSRTAFEEIYRSYAARLLSFCKAYVKDDNEAREIVQDVFVKLWDIRTSVRTQSNIAALIFVIARNRIVDGFRRAVRSRIYEDYVDYIDNVADTASTASRIEYDEFAGTVRRAIGGLSGTQRNVITLCRLEGFSPAEAAEQLSLSEQTVRNQLSQGLRQLQKILARLSCLPTAIAIGCFTILTDIL